jgi:glycosyltransferase involved in cell wall biosynthesis
MKVLHICSFYRPFGGAEKLLFSVLDLLESRGVENVVLAPASQADGATGRRAEHFVDFLEYPFSRSPLLTTIRDNTRLMTAIRDVIAREQPDVIHLHNQQNPFVYKACVDTGIPMVRNVHDPRMYCPTNWRLLPDERLCPHPMGRACLTEGCVKPTVADVKHVAALAWGRQLSFTNTTLIIESEESYALAKQNGYRDDQMALLPNCTHVPSLETAEADRASAYTPGRNQLLFVGRASREKGLPFLLHALTRVRHDFTLNLLTAGDYYQQEIAPLIARLGLESRVNVRLNTSYAETAKYYAAADAVIVPSVWFETFCLVGIEAYTHMAPVIATRVGGIKDWCVDGETGFLVDVFDEVALADRIDRVLGDPALGQRMGRNGFLRAQALYSEQVYFERLHGLYQKVVTDGTRHTDRLSRVAGRTLQPRPGLSGLQPQDGRTSGAGTGPEQPVPVA